MSAQPISDYLPWATFDAPSTVALWDGSYMRCMQFCGPNITSMSESERLLISERINTALASKSERWCWHIEGQNLEVARYHDSKWPTAASELLDAERRAMCMKSGTQFEFRHYLTLTEAPSARLLALGGSLLFGAGSVVDRNEQRDSFRRSCDAVAKLLNGIVKLEVLDDDATATFLHNTVSTRRHPVKAAAHEVLSTSLSDQTLSRGLALASLGNSYLSVMTLGGYPKESSPQLLDAVSKLPFELRWTTRYMPMSRERAKTLMARRELKALGSTQYFQDIAIARLQGKKDGDDSMKREDREQRALAEDAGAAMTRLGTRGWGEMITVFMVWDRNRARCIEKREDLKALLTRISGLVVRDELVEQVKPWRMSLPGNRESGRRTNVVSTRNLADFMPTSSIWQGTEFDAHLAKETGVRRPWMYTCDPVPYRINTDVSGGAAHTLILGRTGQGAKSTLANHFGIQFFGWPKSQVISLSVGRSEFGPCILNGGAVYSVGEKDSLAFQPLAFIDEPKEAAEALGWLQLCLESVGVSVTPAHTEALSEALQSLAGDDRKRRTMFALVRYLKSRSPDLGLALQVYAGSGTYGYIFDGDNAEALERKRWTMFDIRTILGMRNAALVPVLAHLLHRITRWFDGSPTMLLLDEIQEWLHHEQLERFVASVLDTRRKDNVRAMLCTPTPTHLARYKNLFGSVKAGCSTKIYGADSTAPTNTDAYQGLGATEKDIETISRLSIGNYLLKNDYGARVFALNPGPIAFAFTSMSGRDELALLAELHSRCSDADQVTDELLKAKGLQEAARTLGWKTRSGSEVAVAAE